MVGFAFLIVIYLLVDIRWRLNGTKPTKNNQSVVIDSSALIDGRILDVVKAGFVQRRIIIPKVVLQELQLLADGRDAHKRERARLGLDIAIELQQLKSVDIVIDEFKNNSLEKTDELILQLAKKQAAALCTNDFNLNKVASIEGVQVLNMNELAQIMRPNLIPGESVRVKIIQKGEGFGQGVGYLDDGTMAVVDNAAKMKNKTVEAHVIRMIQTKAGKMIFAKRQ